MAADKTVSGQKKSLKKRICQVIILLLIVALVPNAVLAAPTATETEEQRRKAQQEAAERQKREHQKDVFMQKEKKHAEELSLPEESPSFDVKTLKIEGEHVEHFPWVQAMLEKYKGRRIGIQGINLIVKRLTNAFIDRGYVTTRVLVPQQNLSSGTLRLVIVPGVIREIRFQDPKLWGSWRTAFPTRPGNILNLRDLEQGLEQMKRVPSQDVDMQIVPGAKPGESDIVIAVKRDKPWKVVLSMDDSGAKPTGKLQTAQTFSVDNLFGINDLFNVSFNNDADRRGQMLGSHGDSIYYSFPNGNRTFSISGSRYRYHQTIDSTIQPFVYSGESENLEFRVSQLLSRDQARKTHLEFSIIKKKSKSFIDDLEIEVQRKNTTAAKLGVSHRQYFGETTVDVLLAFQRGVPWFGAQADLTGQTPADPTTRYRMWLLDASLNTPVKLGQAKARYSAYIRAQYTDNALYGSEYFSIGNRYTVRGFDGEETLSASKGWFLRNELAVSLQKLASEAYLGLDYGQVTGPGAESLPGRIIMGSVAGLRGVAAQCQYDVFVGWPLRKPAGLRTASPTFGFQLVFQL